MALAALALYVAWFALAFGLRTAIQVRRTGDTGLRWPAGAPGSPEWWAGIGFGVALAVGLAAPISDLAGWPAINMFDHGPVRWAGAAVAAVGVALTLSAQLSMGDSWRIGVDETERTDLITTGAFALARNPIFTAMLVTAVGLALMVPNLVAMVGLAALVVALEVQVRLVEEPYLRSTHGASYDDYASRVGRFVPGLGRRSVQRTGR